MNLEEALKKSPAELEADIAIQREASSRAIQELGSLKLDPVTGSLVINAWAASYCSGSKFFVKYGTTDTRRWWQKVLLVKPFTVGDHAHAMAGQYLERFPSLSPEMVLRVGTACEQGFTRGYERALSKKLKAQP